jgi:hypothetical protein
VTRRQFRIPLLLIAAALAVCLPACKDGDPFAPSPDVFAVNVLVRTPDGEPVSGLRAALSPDPRPGVFRWTYPQIDEEPDEVDLSLRIFDLEGRLVRTFASSAADNYLVWTGHDDQGQPVHDGVYLHALEIHDEEGVVRRMEKWKFFVTGDPDHHIAGVTNERGRFSVFDRTYVPAFYDIDPIDVVTFPEGEFDQIEVTCRTRLTLVAPDGSHQVVIFDAVDRAQAVIVTWDPTAAAAAD